MTMWSAIWVGLYFAVAVKAMKSIARRVNADYPGHFEGIDIFMSVFFGLIWPVGWPICLLIWGDEDKPGILTRRLRSWLLGKDEVQPRDR